MIPRYGSYIHREGELDISISRTIVENDAMQPVEEVVRAELNGLLLATSSAEMDTKFKSLLQAYSENGKDFLVKLPNSQTNSQLSLRSSTAIGGVRVIQKPSVSSLRNAGYVTALPYSIILEAIYPTAISGLLYREFEESVTFSGGGPVYGFLYPLNGPPVRQQRRAQDSYRATQTGFAVGYAARPLPAAPLWQAAQLRAPEITRRSPKRRGSSYRDYFTSWSYEFESNVPLIGNPTAWT